MTTCGRPSHDAHPPRRRAVPPRRLAPAEEFAAGPGRRPVVGHVLRGRLPPQAVWILPSQNVTPRREPDSRNLVDYYLYRTGTREQRFAPEDVIHFRYPDPRDPYTGGLSPLRACYEQVSLTSDFAAFKKAKFENHAIPDALISPEEVLGEEERDRLEAQWNARLRRGGTGKVVGAERRLKVP